MSERDAIDVSNEVLRLGDRIRHLTAERDRLAAEVERLKGVAEAAAALRCAGGLVPFGDTPIYRARAELCNALDGVMVEADEPAPSAGPSWAVTDQLIEACAKAAQATYYGPNAIPQMWHRAARAVLETAARLAPDHVPDAGNMVRRVELAEEEVSQFLSWYADVDECGRRTGRGVIEKLNAILAARAGKGEQEAVQGGMGSFTSTTTTEPLVGGQQVHDYVYKRGSDPQAPPLDEVEPWIQDNRKLVAAIRAHKRKSETYIPPRPWDNDLYAALPPAGAE